MGEYSACMYVYVYVCMHVYTIYKNYIYIYIISGYNLTTVTHIPQTTIFVPIPFY